MTDERTDVPDEYVAAVVRAASDGEWDHITRRSMQACLAALSPLLAARDARVRDETLTGAVEAIKALNPTEGQNVATDGLYAHSYWVGWGNGQASAEHAVTALRGEEAGQ